MQKPVIEVNGLKCSYGSFEAVRGVDFEVNEGELFALLGTNGAGKTTTLETLEGHRRPTEGSVRVLGMDPSTQRKQLRSRTGIMLQESGFAGDLTVAETVDLWQAMSSRPSDPAESLERLELAHRRDVRVKQLSGGERRRLDLVLATLGRPSMLFLDEPTTGLDPESRKAAWEFIRELLNEGVTMLLTTHYLDEAESLAHRLAIMKEGRIAVAGSLVDVLSKERAQIGFDLPLGAQAVDLPEFVGELDRDKLAAGRVQVQTPNLERDLHAVMQWQSAHQLPLPRFRAQHASLDDVFHGVADSSRAEPLTSAETLAANDSK
ncbi:multidrug ABC transporter ATP-binding protein [Amycolatopsis antarctica]|uniref:Multidrug ABC transporter ATP-binding protein n=1 Tax=Amycolatopsis antarctica TaxID=1854586 RepID=A0A263D2F8_9PSEU|nr:ABC transporter ATP-binding protein [Amycolatopsis antarctica]OZM72643.1 multidrug ABC transporter ATP-binding protein [Amycolatopsis antarctica]